MHWLEIFIGLGLSWTKVGYSDASRSATLDVAAAYRINSGVAVGVRGGMAHADGWSGDRGGPSSVDTEYSFSTYDVAATAHVTSGRVLVAPWLGVHLQRGTGHTIYSNFEPEPMPPNEMFTVATTRLAAGTLVGIDVWQSESQSVAIYAEVQKLLTRRHEGPSEQTVSLGIAYRR